MGPVEGAEHLGIKNVCRVVMGGTPAPPFDAESELMKSMRQVVWSSMGDSGSKRNDNASDLDEVLRQAGKYPNVTGSILDDFFISPEHNQGRVARYSLDYIKEMRDRLHACEARPLDFWVVCYKRQLDWPMDEYLKLFDVITYWNMRAPAEFSEIDADFGKVVAKTPGKTPAQRLLHLELRRGETPERRPAPGRVREVPQLDQGRAFRRHNLLLELLRRPRPGGRRMAQGLDQGSRAGGDRIIAPGGLAPK